jgi:FKBP-type peptidyl-prolyl cis-trans isomerase FkpA
VQTFSGSILVLILATFFLAGCGQQDAPVTAAETAVADESADVTAEPAGVTELQITDIIKGEGDTATAGQNVVVHYTGWLYQPGEPDNKGKKFDSSVDSGQPFVFPLGGGRVIQGWDQGVAGMQVGGKRILVIPPEMGYGARGAGGVIPPNATLVFEVDLLEIQP